ncbi:hypothetical protein [Snodgrassella communis]|uniref:hypothetical protein n=1 Tax=Snodgrassella communis TaxID=2946699 RepID=UPI0015D566B5|nr:hypothetical protein [Snodgrassella communis]
MIKFLLFGQHQSSIDDAALLFASYRQFYGLADNQTESRKFIQERLEKQDSAIFIAYHQ